MFKQISLIVLVLVAVTGVFGVEQPPKLPPAITEVFKNLELFVANKDCELLSDVLLQAGQELLKDELLEADMMAAGGAYRLVLDTAIRPIANLRRGFLHQLSSLGTDKLHSYVLKIANLYKLLRPAYVESKIIGARKRVKTAYLNKIMDSVKLQDKAVFNRKDFEMVLSERTALLERYNDITQFEDVFSSQEELVNLVNYLNDPVARVIISAIEKNIKLPASSIVPKIYTELARNKILVKDGKFNFI